MKNNAFSIGIKILTLTCVFFVLINYFGYLLKADTTRTIQDLSVDNNEKFASRDIQSVGDVWVALTTNIGTKFKQRQEIPVTIYKDVIDVGYIISNQNVAKDKIITTNMIAINEYMNVLKTDVRALLASANDRSFALNSFIAQLEYRYKAGSESIKTLWLQRQELMKSYSQTESRLTTLKSKMGKDFSTFKNKETLQNIDEYLKLKEENTNARTYIIFINKYIGYYEVLNNYNKKLLDTLINNKEILVKNSQIVIPDTGSEILRELKVIYTEDEWKSQ